MADSLSRFALDDFMHCASFLTINSFFAIDQPISQIQIKKREIIPHPSDFTHIQVVRLRLLKIADVDMLGGNETMNY